jgi:hypothetical protein
MDLLPVLKYALLIFGAILVLFIVISVFLYKIKTRGEKRITHIPQEREPIRPIEFRYSQEDTVHSIALPENGKMDVLSNTAPKTFELNPQFPSAPQTRRRFEVVSSADMFLNGSQNLGNKNALFR